MSIHIIIDGYNLIRQSDELSKLDRRDIQKGRDALIERLASYRKVKKHKITVVFDGGGAPPFSWRKDRINGIHVLFSRPGELADAVIKRFAQKERERAVIVTSDRDIVHFSENQGAATIPCHDFEAKMAMSSIPDGMVFEEEEEYTGWKPTTKKKGPRRRPSRKERKNRKKIKQL